MKTLKFLCLVLLVLNFGCSNNDDDALTSPEQTYFPTQITTVAAVSGSTVDMNIQYDENNQISQLSIVNGLGTNTFEYPITQMAS